MQAKTHSATPHPDGGGFHVDDRTSGGLLEQHAPEYPGDCSLTIAYIGQTLPGVQRPVVANRFDLQRNPSRYELESLRRLFDGEESPEIPGPYRVSGSAAAIWEYGACGSADHQARLDEYAWLLQSDNSAAELSDALSGAFSFDDVTPAPGQRVRQFEGNSVVVRTLPIGVCCSSTNCPSLMNDRSKRCASQWKTTS